MARKHRVGYIDRSGLLAWAHRHEASRQLPRLVRKLVLETGVEVDEVDFPADEGVSVGGFDGLVRAGEGTPFVPAGLSVWELSVEKSAQSKAESDYSKRTKTPDGSPTREVAYVQAIPRPWTKSAQWQASKRKEGRWRTVQAYNVDRLLTWVESAPATHAWLSEQQGLSPYGLVTADSWWDTWAGKTQPGLPATLVLAGRKQHAAELLSAAPGRILTISGRELDEVLAFIAAAARAEGELVGERFRSRAVFIDEPAVCREALEGRQVLVVVARNEEVAAEFREGSHHLLIVPRIDAKARIRLPAIDPAAAEEALKAAGFEEAVVQEAARRAARSLPACRRMFAPAGLLEPPWASPSVGRAVRRALLLGAWSYGSARDCLALKKLGGASLKDFRDELDGLAAGGDPLLVRRVNSMELASPRDAWRHIGDRLQREDFDSFRQVAIAALLEVDPRLKLPDDRWYLEEIPEDEKPYSTELRQGIVTTLAILATRGDERIVGAAFTCRQFAESVVREVLAAANDDAKGHLWHTLAPELPLLAEAAPDAFLEAVEGGSAGDDPVLVRLFAEGSDDPLAFARPTRYPHLLWALERCAWSAEHFSAAVAALAGLEALNPGGRLTNRPSRSLKELFLPWLPQGSATSERRLAALDGLRSRHPGVAWSLLLELLPNRHSGSMGANSPEYRSWRPSRVDRPTSDQWREMVVAVTGRVIEDAGSDPKRWVQLIDRIDDLLPGDRASALSRLEALDELTENERAKVWEALRKKTTQHREHADQEWALPSEVVDELARVRDLLEPEDPRQRSRWLFAEYQPDLPGARRMDFEEEERAVAAARREAAGAIGGHVSLSELLEFAASVGHPWTLGRALAEAGRHEHARELVLLLEHGERGLVDLAAGYCGAWFVEGGWQWIEKYLSEDVSPLIRARLLLNTREYPRAWEVADSLGDEVAGAFWAHFPTSGLGADFEHVEFVAGGLLEAGRPGGALDLLLRYYRRQGEPDDNRDELTAQALEAVLAKRGHDDEFGRISGIHVRDALTGLAASTLDSNRVARLEWGYLVALGYDFEPPTLSRLIARDPVISVDIPAQIVRPPDSPDASAEVDITDEERSRLDATAYQVLSQVRASPGAAGTGEIDKAELGAWVVRARELLAAADLLDFGDVQIGKLLAKSPAGPDQVKPHPAVRDLLEEVRSPDVEDGLGTALLNSRGVTSRSLDEGGEQERQLAARYRDQAELVGDQWPRTARMLRNVAESLESLGRHYDDDVERLR